jgi:integrase
MKGTICNHQRCRICGGTLKFDENTSTLYCREHPDVEATGQFFVRFGSNYTKRFGRKLDMAIRHLNGLRFKTDEGSFDIRDYQKDKPLGFATQAQIWLRMKEREANIKPKTRKALTEYMGRAVTEWGQMNIKSIRESQIDDFILDQPGKSKTKANIRSCMHDFFTWVSKREKIPMPDIKPVKFTLGWRNIIDMETQSAIMDEINRLTWHINPKIWLGIRWLSIYVSVRPGELISLTERQVDVKMRVLVLPDPKEKKPKIVALLEEDAELAEKVRRMTGRGLPDIPFFRHVKGNGGAKPGQRLGKDYLYKWWKKACSNLGFDSVDLYAGTRHSTVTALGEYFTADDLRESGTFHASEAFERYFQVRRDMSI